MFFPASSVAADARRRTGFKISRSASLSADTGKGVSPVHNMGSSPSVTRPLCGFQGGYFIEAAQISFGLAMIRGDAYAHNLSFVS
jgi:hypothetical protein